MSSRSRRGKPSAAPALAAPTRATTIACALLLLTAGVWAYATSVRGVFVLDDTSAIAWNASIRRLWPPSVPLSPPAGTTVSGRPIGNVSLAINYALAPAEARDVFAPRTSASSRDPDFDRNLWGYHAMNLAIHLAAGLALFGIVRRTLLSARLRERFETSATPLALAIALIWIVHPLQTASVTYVIQRVESLMGLFYLLTLYCAIRAIVTTSGVVSSTSQRRSPRSSHWTLLAVVACALGMATKEAMVTAPIVVWLWFWIFASGLPQAPRPTPQAPRPTPLFVALAATWLIVIGLLFSHPRGATVGFGLQGWTWWTYLLTQAGVVLHYLRLAIVPSPLAFSYAWPMASLGDVWPQFIVLTALVVATIVGVVRRQPAAFLSAWILLILAPTSSVLPIVTEVAAEHRMYLPLAAVVAAVVLAAHAIGARLPSRRAAVIGGIALLVLASASLAAATRARNRVYWSDETLWRDTLDKQPNNARAHAAYAADLFVQGRYREADLEAHIAVRLDDSNAFAQNTLAAALIVNGQLDEAEAHLKRALEIWPFYVDAHRNLGDLYARRRDDVAAVREYSRALDVSPDDPRVLVASARLLATSSVDAARNGAQAVVLAERAVRLTGARQLAPIEVLAAAYAESDRFEDAIAALAQILPGAPPEIAARLNDEIAQYRARQKIRR